MESVWLCDDCVFATAYEDYSTLSLYYTTDEIENRIAGIHRERARLLPISTDFDPDAGWGIKAFFTHRLPTVVAHPYTVNATDLPGCKQLVIG